MVWQLVFVGMYGNETQDGSLDVGDFNNYVSRLCLLYFFVHMVIMVLED